MDPICWLVLVLPTLLLIALVAIVPAVRFFLPWCWACEVLDCRCLDCVESAYLRQILLALLLAFVGGFCSGWSLIP